jgi:hypothetical protein
MLLLLCGIVFTFVLTVVSTPCFAQQAGYYSQPITRLPSLPDLPSGQKDYEVSGNSSDIARAELDINKLGSASLPANLAEELRPNADATAGASKYKIEYNRSTKRKKGEVKAKSRGTKQHDRDTDNSQVSDQVIVPPLSRQPKFGFQEYYQPRQLGQVGFDPVAGQVDNQDKE